ncbi:peptidyl-prolyl cis-trans isomerase [Mucisphaera calidilacus]|uniref:PpiC domain-containing protein n=1 Tax=Mucisphaera calidilacus TaxID=2527982 RepID=A0A518BYI8_9BACT|nr:peptidylprolyl isomerase [Mucisphaera calidilacus]QDU72030.1 hypothetical protein Pan265_18900 [Mucisphaera calidilacus]
MDETGVTKTYSGRAVWRRWASEPVAHFLLLGALLLAVSWLRNEPDRDVLLVTPAMADALEQLREDYLGRPLTDNERRAAIEEYIDEEVLVREARALGFANDTRVRRHLVMKMQSMFETEVGDPTEADLRAIYDAYPERSVIPERVTLDLIAVEESSGEAVMSRLEAGEDPVGLAQRLGRSPFRTLPRYTAEALGRDFGDGFAATVMGLVLRAWSGPFETERGSQLVRVTERFPSRRMTFNEVEPILRDEWTFGRREAITRQRLEALRSGYVIRIERPETSEASDTPEPSRNTR